MIDVPDVPDASAELYRAVVAGAAGLPPVVQALLATATDAVVLLYALVFGLLWWRARGGPPRAMARVLATPVVVVVAYAASEHLKDLVRVDRPCRLVAAAPPILPCPEPGDWSFPSNHATVAGAVAVAVLWSAVRLGLATALVAGAAAASRVVVGVHFPHDVLAGFLLGAAVAGALPTIAGLDEHHRAARAGPAPA